jgi:hypothetical protein
MRGTSMTKVAIVTVMVSALGLRDSFPGLAEACMRGLGPALAGGARCRRLAIR